MLLAQQKDVERQAEVRYPGLLLAMLRNVDFILEAIGNYFTD